MRPPPRRPLRWSPPARRSSVSANSPCIFIIGSTTNPFAEPRRPRRVGLSRNNGRSQPPSSDRPSTSPRRTLRLPGLCVYAEMYRLSRRSQRLLIATEAVDRSRDDGGAWLGGQGSRAKAKNRRRGAAILVGRRYPRTGLEVFARAVPPFSSIVPESCVARRGRCGSCRCAVRRARRRRPEARIVRATRRAELRSPPPAPNHTNVPGGEIDSERFRTETPHRREQRLRIGRARNSGARSPEPAPGSPL